MVPAGNQVPIRASRLIGARCCGEYCSLPPAQARGGSACPPFAPRINPEARILFERGMEANRQGWIETGDQAKSLFPASRRHRPGFRRRLGRARPPDAHGRFGRFGRCRCRRIESAPPPQRALALDPRQREARVALVMLPRWFRRWAEKERAILSLLDDYPHFPRSPCIMPTSSPRSLASTRP